MTRELDQRDFSASSLTPDREAELGMRATEASERLPGNQTVTITAFDPTTGNAAVVAAGAAPSEQGNYVARALGFLQQIHPALGFAPSQPVEFQADPHVQRTSSGAVSVNAQQQYKGIPIFQAAQSVRFGPDGALQDTSGQTITVADGVEVTPSLSVTDAVRRAAEHVAAPEADEAGQVDQFGQAVPLPSVDLTGFQPTVMASFGNEPTHPTVLEAGPFGDEIKASLVWFPLPSGLRLGWEVITAMPNYAGTYRTIVDADNGEILYCHQLVQTALGQAQVFRANPAIMAREVTPFPRTIADFDLAPTALPPGFPDEWVTSNQTVGNSTNAHLGDNGPPLQGATQNGSLVFNPASDAGPDQQVLNIFYFNCFMHDFFYVLGFREADGNFQADNFGRGGLPGDAVDARAHPQPVFGTANMGTPIDGRRPVMNMGLVASTGRHTALDSSVVFHEYTHGVTNRLVGGPLNDAALEAPQSAGMGEGWGDYIACVINNTTVVGDWVVNNPQGIRVFPYDSTFPDNFGDLGTGRYTEEHNIGEIWAATLLEMTRKLGKHLGLQLVVDALKLSPANPSFLDMRDAIVRALDNKLAAGQLTQQEHGTARRGVWSAFSKFGMGPAARSNGAQLSGIVADFNLPPDLPPG